MTDVPYSDKFKDLLRAKFRELGLTAPAAENIAQKIEPVRKIESLVVAQCRDAFHRNLIVERMSGEIAEIAKQCWGPDTELMFEQEAASPAPPQKPQSSGNRRRRTTSFAKSSINLFNFDSEQPIVPEVSPMAQTEAASENVTPPILTPEMSPVIQHAQITEPKRSGAAAGRRDHKLQSEFVFDTFVRGQSNMVAYSACEAVAKNPGRLSNPVFIYGSTGLGKTHLLHAVGNEILKRHPDWRIVYVSSQDFMTEMITSIRFDKTEEFRDKYHFADVLLVDDIQFLESKDSTQMEFFHIFNVLSEKKRQIVITSDKYPRDIPNIEVRLKSRFLQGLIADIEPPSFEDRVAIIEAKAKMMNLKLSMEIIMHIAQHVRSNVREMQGLLTNLMMSQSMTGKAPTIETTNEVLRRIVHMQGPRIDVPVIQKVVAGHFGLKVSDLTSPRRDKKLVLPRHIAMYLTKDLLDLALTEIAENFHRGDHTTVQHAIKKVSKLISEDESTRASVKELRRKLEQSI